ncbi:MAG TPA: LysR family transcriptional regulator ArgP, partial [Rectinemataceae bacterium]|nr:LysR family transcriptional regulator ArgP [Rectinemataceae bacterium]
MLDYRLIEAFAAVIEEGGFERAANRLRVTQSAISQRIKQLEDEVGRILVLRESPPRATEAGERLIRHYRQVASLEEEAIEELGMSGRGGYQHLPIAVNADCLSVWLLEAILPYLRRTAVTLEIMVDDQDRTLRFLRSGEAAGCVSAQKLSIQGFTSTQIGELRYLLCASPGFARQWFPEGIDREAASRAPCIHFTRFDQLQYRALERLFGRPRIEPPAFYIPSTEKFIDAAVAGLAYAMIPEVQAAPLIREGALIELDPG